MNIYIKPKQVFITLLIIIFFLLFFNIISVISRYVFDLYDYHAIKIIYHMFNFNMERNLPTLYSSLALFISSLLLLIIAMKHKSMGSNYLGWFGLMLIFFYIGFDEIAMIHEKVSPLTRQLLNTTGALHFAWIIPYGVLTAIIALVYIPFLLRLPKKIMILFIMSGTIFVSGAIGFEMLEGLAYLHEESKDTLLHAVLCTFEEFLEMFGIALFIYALLSYISDQFDHLTITINKKI